MSVFGGSRKNLFVVIPAAGKSQRMGGEIPKILMDVDGVPVIIRTLLAFQKFADSRTDVTTNVIVVTGSELIDTINSLISEYNITCVYNVIPGGASRTESVAKGVEAISAGSIRPASFDLVFVHDGARCLIDQKTLNNCLEGVKTYEVCAAAVPLKSTVKIAVPLFKDEDKTASAPEAKPTKSLFKRPTAAVASAPAPVEEEKPKKEVFEPIIPEAMREAMKDDEVFNDTTPMISLGGGAGGSSISSFSTKDAPINLFMEMEGRNVPSIGLSGMAAVPKPIDAATSPFKPINPAPAASAPVQAPVAAPVSAPAEVKKEEIKSIRPVSRDELNFDDIEDLDDIDNMDLSFNPFASSASSVEEEVPEVASEPVPAPVSEPEIEVEPEPVVEDKKPMIYEVNATPTRDSLMEVQTPQAFKYEKILKCYSYASKTHVEATDDLSIAEMLKMRVYLVEGAYSNIKITTPEDIIIAESLINRI